MAKKTIEMTIAEIGARATAQKLVNLRVHMLTGIHVSDLPDTSELCDYVDILEDELKCENIDREAVKRILSDIDEATIQDWIYS